MSKKQKFIDKIGKFKSHVEMIKCLNQEEKKWKKTSKNSNFCDWLGISEQEYNLIKKQPEDVFILLQSQCQW